MAGSDRSREHNKNTTHKSPRAGSDKSRQHNKNNNHKSPRAVKFAPRTCAPPKNLKYYWSGSPYKSAGISIYDYHNGRQGNCTAYAWGRFWEISVHFRGIFNNKLSASGNAEDWYYGTNSKFNELLNVSKQIGSLKVKISGLDANKNSNEILLLHFIHFPTNVFASLESYSP